MDEPESRTCSNCKRDIPAVNFTIHSVHCARNIRVCPACKEPVPVAELQEHHEKMHKLLPCKKCGEQVCGTDLEDHIRDSCAHTIQICKFCELELPRRELPAHEAYCGVRTEQCPDCREWVMLKYRQLHLDSNHGFLRLSDDPPPPKKEVVKVTRIPKTLNIPATSTSAGPLPSTSRPTPLANIDQANGTAPTSNENGPLVRFNLTDFEEEGQEEPKLIWEHRALLASGAKNVNKLPKRTNDQPQINTNTTDCGKASLKKLLKKRPAPQPPQPQRSALRSAPAPAPQPAPPPSPLRDLPFYSALERAQREERQRREQNAYNLAHGLPPVLNPAEKLEKLRKMDRLQNPDAEPAPGTSRPQTRNVLISPVSPEERWSREELRNLKPMSSEQFAQRFNALRLNSDSGVASGNRNGTGGNAEDSGNSSGTSGTSRGTNGNGRRGNENDRDQDRRTHGDRFSEIKSSLRELRRGLNEVTAPYNSNAMANEPANGRHRSRRSRRDRGGADDDEEADVGALWGDVGGGDAPWGAADVGGGDVQLPCEFCGQLQPLHDLVQHQTGCRPDLAQLLPRRHPPAPAAPAPAPLPSRLPHPDPHELPVIPCEFCTESLPVYLISEHQERCRRDASPLYLD